MSEIPYVELIAVCDVNRQRAEEVSRKYGIKPYEDSMEMYKGKDIDAVTICVWSSSLAQEAIKALKIGKHVFVEKPMASSVKEAMRSLRLANASIPKGANGALYPEDLDIHAQILLLAILEALKNRAYITVEDALSSYRILCEQEGITQEEEEALREYIRALAREGYIITQNQRIAVEYPVDKPIQTLRKTIRQKAKSL